MPGTEQVSRTILSNKEMLPVPGHLGLAHFLSEATRTTRPSAQTPLRRSDVPRQPKDWLGQEVWTLVLALPPPTEGFAQITCPWGLSCLICKMG